MSSAFLRFTVLGCGSSSGVPRVGGDWGACDRNEPRNRRRRSSLLVERVVPGQGSTVAIIDTGPDFREQMLDAGIGWADGIIYTHPHADHIHGVDDIRAFAINEDRILDVYADKPTLARLHEAFAYCFLTPPGSNYPPIARAHAITAGKDFAIHGPGGRIDFLPFRQIHGDIDNLGFRIGGFAYATDLSFLPQESRALLTDLDILMVDALRYKPHPSHLTLEQALELIEDIKPRRAILTHMHIDLDYRTLCCTLPSGVEPAYDGMVIELRE